MKCNFCNEEIEKGKGKLYVLKDGTRYLFCGGKCQTNQLKLKRKPRKVKWITKKKKTKDDKK